jgi:uncharacterized protein (UPF0305 family)
MLTVQVEASSFHHYDIPCSALQKEMALKFVIANFRATYVERITAISGNRLSQLSRCLPASSRRRLTR